MNLLKIIGILIGKTIQFLLKHLLGLLGVQVIENPNYLLGEKHIISCFVSSTGNSWSKEEKEEVVSKIKKAENWIVQEAKKREVNVSFKNIIVGMNKDLTIKKSEGSLFIIEALTFYFFAKKVLKKIGRDKVKRFFQGEKYVKNQNIQLAIFYKGNGRSFATPDICFGHNIKGATMLYSNHCGNGIEASLIAHEFLHLYGAADLYEEFKSLNLLEKIAKSFSPKSIMLSSGRAIERYHVDRFNAWLIGW